MRQNLLRLILGMVFVCLPCHTTSAQIIKGTGSYKGAGPGWDREMQTTMHCGNNPESWVRGSASLDKSSGALSVTIELETDSVFAGPKGRVLIAIKNAGGDTIYSVTSDEIGIGGKPPGNVVIRNFSSNVSIPVAIAQQASSLYLDAQCTGSINRLFNLDLNNPGKGFDLGAAGSAGEVSPGSPEARNLVASAVHHAEGVSTKGTPQFTAALRRELSAQGAALLPSALGPSTLDLDNRYRSNFSDQTRVWGPDSTPPGTFPDTVAITGNGAICTGIVIGPRSILTAAHCYCHGVKDTVYFGDTVNKAISKSHVLSGKPMIPCDAILKIQSGDVAILTVDSALTIPPRVFASSALIDSAKFGRAVGFGVGMNVVIDPAGIKRMVDVPMASVACNGNVKVGETTFTDSEYYHCAAGREIVAGAPSLDKDTCNGDSGGPLYIESSDGSLYLAATTSRPTGAPGVRPCGDGGIYVRTDGDVTKWIQSNGVHILIAQ